MREAFRHKKALSAATLRARDPRPQRRRQSSIPDSRERRIDIFIIAHCIRFCILLLALTGLCGLGALIEQGKLFGLVLAVACALLCRELAALLPEGRRNTWR